MNQQQWIINIGITVLLACFCFFIATTYLVVSPWLRALLSGAQVPLLDIVGMRLRGTRATLLINIYISLRHSGYNVSLHELEALYLQHRYDVRDPHDLFDVCKKHLAHTKTDAPPL